MTRVLLPVQPTRAEYLELRASPSRWMPALLEIARALGRGGEPLVPIESGSNLLALLGDELVIKLFPPLLRYQYQSERVALQLLEARLTVSTPRVVADSEIEGWPYLVMTRLPGVGLATVWDRYEEAGKCAILRDIGALIAEVQCISPGELATLHPPWNEFLSHQTQQCKARHTERGLPHALLADLDRYLERTASVLPIDAPSVLLTGEFTPENLLMQQHAGAWKISGLIDFGDSTVGFGEYDLLGPGTFMASGNPAHLKALLAGFGYTGAQLSTNLRQRLMRLLLIHRHSDLTVQVKIDGWHTRVKNLDQLEQLLWPL